MNYSFRISGQHHRLLQEHLFPGDGLEAVAFVLCGRGRSNDQHVFTAQKIVPVPYEMCQRTSVSVTWRSDLLPDLLYEASHHGLSVVKVHSHPAFYERFSTLDDESDEEIFVELARRMKLDACTESVEEVLNQIASTLADLQSRSAELRRYL